MLGSSQSSSGVGVAKAVCLWQVLIATLVTAGAAIFWGRPQAVAAFYGSLVAIVPTIYFAVRAFARRPDAKPADVVGAIFRGEMGKLALTAVLFAIGVKLFAAQFPALLVAFAACLMAYWIVMARMGFGGTDRT